MSTCVVGGVGGGVGGVEYVCACMCVRVYASACVFQFYLNRFCHLVGPCNSFILVMSCIY